LQVISMAFLTADDAPIIWGGPMLHGALQQFFREVRWVDLDYVVIDLPPGTGDVALSLSQSVPVAGAIVVTTPQQVSLADTRRAVAMYKKLNIPPIGVVENMSYFACPDCGHEADIFGRGGGEQLAAEVNVPFLGRIPIYQPIREGSDARRGRREGGGCRARAEVHDEACGCASSVRPPQRTACCVHRQPEAVARSEAGADRDLSDGEQAVAAEGRPHPESLLRHRDA